MITLIGFVNSASMTGIVLGYGREDDQAVNDHLNEFLVIKSTCSYTHHFYFYPILILLFKFISFISSQRQAYLGDKDTLSESL